MTTNTNWLLPRTRVGRVGMFAACGCAVLGLFDVAGGWLMGAGVVTQAIVWTALLRHGDRALMLWLLGTMGLGWLVLTLMQ